MKLYKVHFDEQDNFYKVKETTLDNIIVAVWENDCIGCMKFETADEYKNCLKHHQLMLAEAIIFYESLDGSFIEFSQKDAFDKMDSLNVEHEAAKKDVADTEWCADMDRRKEQAYWGSMDRQPSSYEDIRGL